MDSRTKMIVRVSIFQPRAGDGLDPLLEGLIAYSRDYFGAGESALISRARHRQLLTDTEQSLARAAAAKASGDELVAEHLRLAAHTLGRLVGRVDVEDVLGAIFSKFCIGK